MIKIICSICGKEMYPINYQNVVARSPRPRRFGRHQVGFECPNGHLSALNLKSKTWSKAKGLIIPKVE